jgi:hypothetical protein
VNTVYYIDSYKFSWHTSSLAKTPVPSPSGQQRQAGLLQHLRYSHHSHAGNCVTLHIPPKRAALLSMWTSTPVLGQRHAAVAQADDVRTQRNHAYLALICLLTATGTSVVVNRLPQVLTRGMPHPPAGASACNQLQRCQHGQGSSYQGSAAPAAPDNPPSGSSRPRTSSITTTAPETCKPQQAPIPTRPSPSQDHQGPC